MTDLRDNLKNGEKTMFKLAGNVIDCYDDAAFMTSIKAQKFIGVRMLDPEELEKLADHHFAAKITAGNTQARRYPIYNDWITKISCVYFLDKEDQLPENLRKVAGANLAEACRKHSLNVPKALSKYEKVASNKVVVKDAPVELGVSDAEELRKELVKQAKATIHRLSPADRVVMANELDKVGAAKYDQYIYDYVPKYGDGLEKELEVRRTLLKSADDSSGDYIIRAMDALYAEKDSLNPVTFAARLAELDKQAGFKARYKGGFKDAFVSTFGGTKANDEKHTPTRKDEEVLKHGDEPVDVETGADLNKEASEEWSIARHIHSLKHRYSGPDGMEKMAKKQPTTTKGNRFVEAFKILVGR